ncbi:hypothetical protein [Streptomyces brevispora]|uniref:hypothetical protein n=1 Tax=Streptomyces brevispora TaxID=887462 RepID=UPI0039A75EAE
MHRTRTIVKLLVAVSVTALSGCVSVQPPPSDPPRPATGRPAQDLAPQIGLPPVRDTLEAVPAPKPSASSPSAAARRGSAAPPAAPHAGPRVPQPRNQPVPERPHPRPRRAVPVAPVPVLPAPVTGRDVCALGRGYGHWPAGSPQSRICDHTYGR